MSILHPEKIQGHSFYRGICRTCGPNTLFKAGQCVHCDGDEYRPTPPNLIAAGSRFAGLSSWESRSMKGGLSRGTNAAASARRVDRLLREAGISGK